MAFDTGAALDALRAVVLTVTGLQSVTFGWPTTTTPLAAWITVGGRGTGPADRSYGGALRREARMVVWVGFSVGSAPSATERAMAVALDDLEAKLYAARATNLGGAVDELRIDFTLADNPDYLSLGGAERRVYPVGVNAVQSDTAPL